MTNEEAISIIHNHAFEDGACTLAADFEQAATMAINALKSPWKDITEEPQNGDNILCYHWYDGPHYFQGYYVAETKEVEFELPENGRCFFDTIEKWMPIPEFEKE